MSVSSLPQGLLTRRSEAGKPVGKHVSGADIEHSDGRGLDVDLRLWDAT
jgi:hypothetical protein